MRRELIIGGVHNTVPHLARTRVSGTTNATQTHTHTHTHTLVAELSLLAAAVKIKNARVCKGSHTLNEIADYSTRAGGLEAHGTRTVTARTQGDL